MEEFIEYLLEDHVIHRTLSRHKQECLGNIPRRRDSLDIPKILEGLTAESGDRVKYLDFNELWEDEEFRTKFDSVNVQERVILLTTESLFNSLKLVTRASVDGTFRIAPAYWYQIFILEAQIGDKWIPVIFGLPPNKEKISYRLFFGNIEYELRIKYQFFSGENDAGF